MSEKHSGSCLSKSLFCLVFLFAFITSATSAQSRQQKKTDSVFMLVQQYFNEKQADSIYAMAGDNFQRSLSLPGFRAVMNRQLFPLEDIKGSSLISFVNNKLSTYKLILSDVTLQLQISLDQSDKIDLLLFQPFKQVTADKMSSAASSNKLLSPLDKQVDAIARPYIQQANTVGLSIGVLKNGQMSVYSYGEVVKGSHELPNNNTIFEIGSITKTFTATLLAWYANEGKVKLTDPITKYLPDSVAANAALKGVTLLSLSNHTSGLPRMPDNLVIDAANPLNPYRDYNQKQLYAYLKNCKLDNPPGGQYAYSNLAFGLLGNILSRVSGKSYEQMVEEIICKPLGLKNTAQHLSVTQKSNFTAVYNQQGDLTPAWDFDVLAPCGALRSSVDDLLVFAKANMANDNSKLEKAISLTHQITFNKDLKLGLGWHMIVVEGVEYYYHNGGTYGSSSFLAFNAEKNIAVIVLSNAAENTDAIGTGILKLIQ